MRDIRKLDNVFSISNEPSIAVRQQAILINAGVLYNFRIILLVRLILPSILDPIRAVILRDCCLVFLPDKTGSLCSLIKRSFQENLGEHNEETEFEFMYVFS